MTRFLTLSLLSITLAACGGDSDDSSTDGSSGTEPVTDTDTDAETDPPTHTDTPTDTDPPPDTDTPTDTDVNAVITCQHWCELMEEHCPADMLHPFDGCMTFCETSNFDTLPTGQDGDTDVDTLACRIHYAEEAGVTTDPTTKDMYCSYANASGGNQCGSWCDTYCNLSLQMCSTAVVGSDNYASDAECQAACSGFSTDPLDGISQPEQLFGYGDTVQCRLHHLHVGVMQGETNPSMYGLHCPHTSEPSTADTCSDLAKPNTANYCAYATEFCTGANDLLPGAGAMALMPYCTSTVGALAGPGQPYVEAPFESFTDNSGSSLGCLNYWIVLAPLDPDLYCGMADWDPAHWVTNGGNGVCHP